MPFVEVKGTVSAPSSKSYTQRAVALACLSKGPTKLLGVSLCDDEKVALNIARHLGCKVLESLDEVVIDPNHSKASDNFFCGESATGLRIFLPVCAKFRDQFQLTKFGTLIERELGDLKSWYQPFGLTVSSTTKNEVSVAGILQGNDAKLDGSHTSQILSGLLVALPTCTNDSELNVSGLVSTPYVSLTLNLIKLFGGQVDTDENFSQFKIVGNQRYLGQNLQVEGDWSGASFFLIAGAISGSVTVTNLNVSSQQADRAIIEVLRMCGATVSISESQITASKDKLNAFDFNASNCPDLFPPLAVLASYCRGKSRIRGISRLRSKESDRALAIVESFSALGVDVTVSEDSLIITGGKVSGGRFKTFDDHRICMAGAVCGLQSDGAVEIDNMRCVAKSFPDFFYKLNSLVSS